MNAARKPLLSRDAAATDDAASPRVRGDDEPRLFLGIGYGLILAALIWIALVVALVLWLRS